MHKFKKICFAIVGAAIVAPAFALNGTINTSDLPLSQRVSQLESQVGAQSNLKQQIQNLQQSVKRQGHVISMLQQRVLQLDALVMHTPSQPEAPGTPAQTSSMFDVAYGAILQGDYTKAENNLQAYLQKNPKGSDAPAAHYWLGEINMLTGNSGVAAKEFRLVVSDFPKSEKAAEALRQLGTIFLSNGDSQHAKKTFEEVIKRYPNSASAILAKKSLASMK